MTNKICSQNIPAYSGITINITNPSFSPQTNPICQPDCQCHIKNNAEKNGIYSVNSTQTEEISSTQKNYKQEELYSNYQNTTNNINHNNIYKEQTNTAVEKEQIPVNNIYEFNQIPTQNNTGSNAIQNYPAEYYLNNYNITPTAENKKPENTTVENVPNNNDNGKTEQTEQELNTETSKEIINELETRVAEQEELEKNGKQTRVVALTNEYIKSLENYLDNPNTDIRLMAAKEILTRLDEDKDRYDDAALNALLNKMLQDPSKLVRIAALSAFSSQLASGNDYTITLLTEIQNNPNADKEDVLQAADSLLKMSTRTEIKYTPIEYTEKEQVKE